MFQKKKAKLRNLNTILMAEWIDCEAYIKDNEVLKIAEICYRDEEGNLHDLSHLPYETIMSSVKAYMNWRNLIFKSFPAIFSDSKQNEERRKKQYEHLGIKQTEEEKDYEEKDSEWWQQFGYYSLLFHKLCNGNFFNMVKAYNTTVIEAFNHITFVLTEKK